MPRAPFPPIDFKTRFPALDGIRALAVTLVFALHFGGGGTHGGRILRLIDTARLRGGVGVDIFFALSGFLITGILYDTRHDSHFFGRFFARRSVRIFPVVYLLFAVLFLLTPILHYHWRGKQFLFLVYLGNFAANADFTLYDVLSSRYPAAHAQLGHLWSLCVEEQFYCFWPILVWLIRDRVKLIWTSLGLSVLALLLRILMVELATPDAAQRWIARSLPFRLDGLLAGAILALLLRSPAAPALQRSMKWVFLAGLLPLLVLYRFSPNYNAPLDLTLGFTLTAIASAGLIGMTLLPGSPAYRLFHLRPARILGKYSYGFYIWHVVWAIAWIQVLIFLTGRLHSVALAGVVTLTLAFVATFLVAKLSYDLFEVRFLGLKRRFEYDSEQATHQTAFTPEGR